MGGGFRYPNPQQREDICGGLLAITVQYLVDRQLSIEWLLCFDGGKRVLIADAKNQTSAKLVIQKSNFNRKRLGIAQPLTHTHSQP